MKTKYLLIALGPLLILLFVLLFIAYIVTSPIDAIVNAFNPGNKELEAINEIRSQFNVGQMGSGKFAYPCDEKFFWVKVAKAGEYGSRINPLSGNSEFHAGHDFPLPEGEKVFAAESGVVTHARIDATGLGGNLIIIDHGKLGKDNYDTWYAHLSKIKVREGQRVNRGDLIGLSGQTGMVTGPHLHFEIRVNNLPKDPLLFYSKEKTKKD